MELASERLVRELIRLIVAEADPKKRKVLAEKLELLLRQEPQTSHFANQ